MNALNDRGKALKGAKVLVLGISYKKDVDDMRESPSVELLEKLQKKGAEIAYSDPHVPIFPRMRRYRFDLRSVHLTAENLATYDCVLIATNHAAFDYELIRKNAQLIIDTRGVYRDKYENLIKA